MQKIYCEDRITVWPLLLRVSWVLMEGESDKVQRLSYKQLRETVGQYAAALQRAGVQKGDRVAGFVPNCLEAVLGMD